MADKQSRGTAHAVFDHSGSLEELREIVDGFNSNSDIHRKARYELHHQGSSGLELDVGLQDVLKTSDDYRVMSNDLRKEYPPENRQLSDHEYVLVAKSNEGHESTAEELSYTMNQIHLLNNDTKVFRGAIVHKDEKQDHYHVH